MNFLELAKSRYSVRKYLPNKVEDEKLNLILQAGQAAPTAANLQPQRCVVVQTKQGLERIGKTANIYGAPLAIIVCADQTAAWIRPFDQVNFGDIDTAIVTDHMMLEAASLGLGSVWIGYFDPNVIREEFHLDAAITPVHILAIGYTDEKSGEKSRKALSETITYA